MGLVFRQGQQEPRYFEVTQIKDLDGIVLLKVPKHKKQAILNTISMLKQQVVWKWDPNDLEDVPDNVYVSSWLPQQDILGHSNLKLFVNHGGQSSIQECWCYGKPMVSFKPVFI